MYKLTNKMCEQLQKYLEQYHKLFKHCRCRSEELEELIVKSIASDNHSNHKTEWKEGSHDKEKDITVFVSGRPIYLQVKSGTIKNKKLKLSGPRLTRFKGDLSRITSYINCSKTQIVAVPKMQNKDSPKNSFQYLIAYIDAKHLTGLKENKWSNKLKNGKKGESYMQSNNKMVEFTLSPNMSWQLWWTIPEKLIDIDYEITIILDNLEGI